MKPAVPLSPMMDLKTVARTCGVSTKTAGRWVARGELHAHQLGRQLRVSEEDLRLFIATRRL